MANTLELCECLIILCPHLVGVTILILAQSLPLAVLLSIMVHLGTGHTARGLTNAAVNVFTGCTCQRVRRACRRRPRVIVNDGARVRRGRQRLLCRLLELRTWCGLMVLYRSEAFGD